jgi:hypothetical protein
MSELTVKVWQEKVTIPTYDTGNGFTREAAVLFILTR